MAQAFGNRPLFSCIAQALLQRPEPDDCSQRSVLGVYSSRQPAFVDALCVI